MCALALAACGGGEAPDLFVLERSGLGAGARLTLRVTDGGEVSCNGRALVRLPDARVLDARALARDLAPDAAEDRSLPPGPDSVLRYRVRLPEGTIAFADTSRGLGSPLLRAQAFARQVSTQVCRLPR